MSPRTRITTLNLGSQSIEVAEFRTQPQGGLILCGYRSRELLADPARLDWGQVTSKRDSRAVSLHGTRARNNRINGVGLVEVYHFP
jgi:hypothetical protein